MDRKIQIPLYKKGEQTGQMAVSLRLQDAQPVFPSHAYGSLLKKALCNSRAPFF